MRFHRLRELTAGDITVSLLTEAPEPVEMAADGTYASSTPMSDIREAMAKIDAARRTIVCRPELVDQVQAILDAHHVGGLYTVVASPHCPADHIVVINVGTWTAAHGDGTRP